MISVTGGRTVMTGTMLNVNIVAEYDSALRPLPKGEGSQMIDGRVVWKFERLDVGKKISLEVDCQCLQQSPAAFGLVEVTADSDTPTGSIRDVERHLVEILAAEGRPLGAGSIPPPAATGGGPLRLSIMAYNNPARAGAAARYQIDIRNASNQADGQVTLHVRFPPELIPNMNSIKAGVKVVMVQDILQFYPIATLRPDEPISFLIPVKVNKAGIGDIEATLTSNRLPQGLRKVKQIEILPP